MPHLYIIRGLPGSGKSTKANELSDWGTYHYEADMFFTFDGEYKFNSQLLGAAHDWCYSNTVRRLSQGCDVIVSNTFTKLWELERYLAIPGLLPDVTVSVIEMKTQYESIHNIPEEKFNQMVARWEEIPDVWSTMWNINVVRIT
jgi:hypothetical protein